MGNTTSSSSNSNKSAEKSFDNFYDIIDYIATYYILTMDFKSLSKLCEKEYCDKLVVITSDIIKRYFNDMDVTYLAQRIKNGQEVNDLTKENVIYVNKDQLESLDISNDAQKNIKKKRVCIGIAKFYIKIAHIFAAIVMTVNPVYSYKDSNGQTVKTGLMEKDKIPKGVNRQLYKLNICDNRIRALLKGQEPNTTPNSIPNSIPSSIPNKTYDLNAPKPMGPSNLNPPKPMGTSDLNPPKPMGPFDLNPPKPMGPSDLNAPKPMGPSNLNPPNPMGPSDFNSPNSIGFDISNPPKTGGANEIDDEITMQPKICDMNTNKDGTAKSLIDEPGIQELLQLYLDDKYDYSNGEFTGMSDETRKQFQKDLKTFYTAFTGNDVMPPEITKFSDIKLKDYNKLKGCQGATPTLKNKYTINKNDKLFVEYAKNTKDMIQTAASNQSKLLEVINELFTYVIDPYTGKQKIRINPKLTEESLQKSVEKTRKLIIALYVECEMGYVRGIKLYEAIVEAKILETTQKQIQSLKKEASHIIDETTKIISKPPQNPVDNDSENEILDLLAKDTPNDTSKNVPINNNVKLNPIVPNPNPVPINKPNIEYYGR